MKRNVASQKIGAQMVSATDGSAFTGSVTVSVTGDAGTQATGSVGSGACTHEGNGYHTYAPAQSETDYDLIAFTFTGTGAVPATVQVFTTFPQTGDSFARLGAPAGASVSADIAAIEAQTDDIGTAGAGLSAVPWNAAWDAEVQSEVADALAAYDPPTKAELDTAESNIRGADSDTLKSLSDQIDGLSTAAAPQLLQNTTIATLASQTSFTLTAGSADDDAYNGAIIVVTDQSTATQKAVGSISSYVGSTKTVTLSADPGIFTMAVGDTVDILAAIGSAPSAASIRAEIDSNSTQLAAIKAKTDNLPSDPADASVVAGLIAALEAKVDTVDSNVDAILVDTSTTLQGELDGIQADTEDIQSKLGSPAGASVSADIAAVKAQTAAIETDTQDIQSRIPAALASGNMKTDVLAVNGSTTGAAKLALGAGALITGAAATGTLSTTQATSNLTGYANDQLIGRVVTFTSGDCEGESSAITDYASASGLLTFDALTTAPGNGDTFVIS